MSSSLVFLKKSLRRRITMRAIYRGSKCWRDLLITPIVRISFWFQEDKNWKRRPSCFLFKMEISFWKKNFSKRFSKSHLEKKFCSWNFWKKKLKQSFSWKDNIKSMSQWKEKYFFPYPRFFSIQPSKKKFFPLSLDEKNSKESFFFQIRISISKRDTFLFLETIPAKWICPKKFELNIIFSYSKIILER